MSGVFSSYWPSSHPNSMLSQTPESSVFGFDTTVSFPVTSIMKLNGVYKSDLTVGASIKAFVDPLSVVCSRVFSIFL
jgi:hypothetical protein